MTLKTPSEYSSELDKYPYPPRKCRINGKDVSIAGFEHTSEFFEKYKLFFEDIVSQHDAIVLEQSIGGEFWEDREFFGRIGDIAYSKQKRVYQADPVNHFTHTADSHVAFTGSILSLLGAGMGVTAAYGYAKKRKPGSKLSRRDFLKVFGSGFALFGVGQYLWLGTYKGLIPRGIINKKSLIEYGIDDFLLWGETDYRNVKIAEGTDKICHKVDDLKSIASIHGAAHYKTVETYLKNPVLRKKKLAYLPYEIIGNRKVREYIPNETGWTLSRKF